MFSVKAEPSTNIINVEFDVLIELELTCSSQLFFAQYYGPFALAIFAGILAAISSAILRHVNYWRFRSDSLHG